VLLRCNGNLNTSNRAVAKYVRKENTAKNIRANIRGSVGLWRTRWINELYSLYKQPNIDERIKLRRLEWAGHLIRMEEQRFPTRILNGKINIARPVGRPRIRWADVVQRDASQLLW
jgi:hypothetical protein